MTPSCSGSYLPTPAPSCPSTSDKPHTPIDLRVRMKKRRSARRLKISILVVPIVLIIIALSTRCVSHPAVFDILSADGTAQGWRALAASVLDWQGNMHDPHEKREVEYELELEARSPQTAGGVSFPAQSATRTSSTGSAMSVMTASETATSTAPSVAATSSGSSTIPTIPSEPPVLPTPFPQPFDSTGITTNFSTDGCRNFFLNMTQAQPFRQCRPFSMLIQHSSAFIEVRIKL